MKDKELRRVLADARASKKQLLERNLKIDWARSAFLCRASTYQRFIDYYETSKDNFAFKHDELKETWFLFDVRLIKDDYLDDLAPELAIVLESNKRLY